MSSKIRIYPPRKLKTRYLHYDYTVVYYEVNGDTRKRSYFADLKSANEFYAECKRKLKSQANALAGQSAREILEYRSAETIANNMGLSMPELFDKIVQAYKVLKKNNYNGCFFSLLDDYRVWRSENDPNITLDSAVKSYLEMVLASKKRNSTKTSNVNFWNRFRREFSPNGNTPLVALNAKRLESWLIDLKSIKHTNMAKVAKISLPTKHNYLVMLITFFNYCVKMGYISRNPAKFIILPALKRPAPKAYTPDDIIAALKLFEPGSVHRLYICIAAFAGIRPAEIGRLKWLDIDLEERVIRLSSLATKMSSRRTVHVQDNLYEWLHEWREYFGTDKLIVPEVDRVQWLFLKKFKQSGHKVIHDGLRHSFGSYLQALTDDCDLVTEQMGHTLPVFKSHYMDLVSKEDAQRYFAITPQTIKI